MVRYTQPSGCVYSGVIGRVGIQVPIWEETIIGAFSGQKDGVVYVPQIIEPLVILVSHRFPVVHAPGVAKFIFQGVPVEEGRAAQKEGEDPDNTADGGCKPDCPVILAPDGFGHQEAPVNADGGEEEDAGKHVENDGRGENLAEEPAEGPALAEGQLSDGEGQGEAADEVGDRQVQEPDRVDRSLHLQDDRPDDQEVSREAQEEGDGENGQRAGRGGRQQQGSLTGSVYAAVRWQWSHRLSQREA